MATQLFVTQQHSYNIIQRAIKIAKAIARLIFIWVRNEQQTAEIILTVRRQIAKIEKFNRKTSFRLNIFTQIASITATK